MRKKPPVMRLIRHYYLCCLVWLRAKLKPDLGNLIQYSPRPFKLKYIAPKTLAADKLPTISIVTPSYNQGHFIKETIDSVLQQHYPKLQYIVQDGRSKDDTLNTLKKYANTSLTWESITDLGQSHALNLGFSKTRGEIMAYLNSDDILLPGSLHYIATIFADHPEVDVVYGHRVLIDAESNEIGRWVLPGHDNNVLEWADFIPQETLFWRRSLWEKAGGCIDENFKFAMDWDLLLRFKKAGARFKRLPRFLGAFRIHSTQKTSALINKHGVEEMDILRKRCHLRVVSYRDIRQHVTFYLIKHMLHNCLYKLGLTFYK